MKKQYRVALYFNLTKMHHQGMVNGIIRYARERGNWDLFGAYWPMGEIGDYRHWRGDGIIAAVETREDIRMVTSPGVPVVDTSGAILDESLSLVTNDNIEIGRIAGDHFVENGLERFAFCAVDGSLWSEDRLKGFRLAVRETRPGRLPVFRRDPDWWNAPGFSDELVEFLLKRKGPIGVMAANDIVGLNVAGACRLAGLKVPDEVSIVSVDNDELLCELSTPPMSSISFNRNEIGLRAAERLDVLMRRLLPDLPPLRVKPKGLVERASSSTIAVADPLVAGALGIIRASAVNNLSAGEVAAGLFTSRRNLERRFRDQLGRTLLEEIHRTRIKHAKRLLRDRDLSLKKVSALSGFRTLDRFTSIFERYAGMSPQEYRREGAGE